MSGGAGSWADGAVVYQVYPRSFQDSDGDGEGDLAGIRARLPHIAALGADAVWLSPIYPSPMADGGYDVADYTDVDPRFGTVADVEALVQEAHALGLRVLLDVVPCHTSIEHRWFREHPERYVWSGREGPANNWQSVFAGAAWSPDPYDRGLGWYLHSFYPEQPDLNWRHPDVPGAVGEALRFWRERGVDGFRLDALDRLMKDPELRDEAPASAPPPLPEGNPDLAALEHRHARNAPDIATAIAHLREAAGDDAFLVGEVYLPSSSLRPYLEHLDVCFSFELFHARWEAEQVRAALHAAQDLGPGRVAWVLSNHDFPRLPDRVGERHTRAAAMLLLSLPGSAFVFQGDEIGMADGPGAEPPRDRAGRDRHRHPMQWEPTPLGGFTTGEPWLPMADPQKRSVAAQEGDPDSMLALYRDLIALRRGLGGELRILDDAPEGVVAFTRDGHVVAVNLAGGERPAPAAGRLLRHTHRRDLAAAPAVLGPGEGFVAENT